MPNYPSRFDRAKQYLQVRFTDTERYAHSYDMNDIQLMLRDQVRGLARAAGVPNGLLLTGAAPLIDVATGDVTTFASEVHIDGQIYIVDAGSFVVPTGQHDIGVCITLTDVDYTTDTDLVGQAAGTRAQGEPGQDRLKYTAHWTYDGVGCAGDFYPIFRVVDRVIIIAPQVIADPIQSQLARYDREANGHYIVKGFRVKALGPDAGDQVFSIEEGTVNVWGNKIDQLASLRRRIPEAPDLLRINSEPHVSTGGPGEVINFNRTPAWAVQSVTILKEKTVTVTHGAFSGAVDVLPDTAVQSIVEVVQGATTYVATTDYVLNGDSVDWTPGGDEPAPSSSYDVTYRYFATAAPDDWDRSTFTVSNAVVGSSVTVTYDWALPRIDIFSIDREGTIHFTKGQSVKVNPWPPRPPLDHLKLAEITNLWGIAPTIKNVGTYSVHYNMLQLFGDMIFDLYDLVAQERLKNDVTAREVAAKRGLFVDGFFDDDLRDLGIAQTGAIVENNLRLPIAATAEDIDLGADPILLDYTEEVILSQELVSGCWKINPYQVFDPLPATIELDPAVDFWVQKDTAWASDVTRTFVVGEDVTARSETELTINTARIDRSQTETLRTRTVNFTIKGFGNGETLDLLTFDGIDITPA